MSDSHADRRIAEDAHRRRESLGSPRQIDVVAAHDQARSLGDRAADAFARTVGSWRFIGIQSVVLCTWVVLNATGMVVTPWDPYPFILLNLALSFQAAYAAPILMMSQNRAADLDRAAARADHSVNQHAELEVEEILALLRTQVATIDQLRAEVAALANPTS